MIPYLDTGCPKRSSKIKLQYLQDFLIFLSSDIIFKEKHQEILLRFQALDTPTIYVHSIF